MARAALFLRREAFCQEKDYAGPGKTNKSQPETEKSIYVMTQVKEKKKKAPRKQAAERVVPKGRLLAIGGKESKEEEDRPEDHQDNKGFVSEQILKRLVQELKGKDPLLVIIPAASTAPEEAIRDYTRVFTQLGVRHVQALDIRTREDAANPDLIALIDKAAGMMLAGGDQLRLTAILGGTPLLEHMRKRYIKSSVIIAGTSAGAAALSTNMIYAGEAQGGILKGQMSATAGLNLLKNVVIDTHFIERGRIIRMAQAVAQNPGCIGIGLEADTAILVTAGDQVEVIGSGLVTILDGMNISSTNIYEISQDEPFTIFDLKMHLLGNGKTYQIPAYNEANK
jgi:cyanophycinase